MKVKLLNSLFLHFFEEDYRSGKQEGLDGFGLLFTGRDWLAYFDSLIYM